LGDFRYGLVIATLLAWKVILFAIGSSGNCVFVRIGQTRLLFECRHQWPQGAIAIGDHGHDIRDVECA